MDKQGKGIYLLEILERKVFFWDIYFLGILITYDNVLTGR